MTMRVKEKFPNVRFILVGPKDPSPDGIPLNEVDSWAEYIDYKGSVTDVRPYIKKSHVYVLPSYHEGLPRSTLEAMSMGRAILSFSLPCFFVFIGCIHPPLAT